MTVEEFRARVKANQLEQLIDSVILADGAAHLSQGLIEEVSAALARTYGLRPEDVKAVVVGSAKLGFSLTEHRRRDVFKPRYRAFGPESDIDVVIVSSRLFDSVWNELSSYAHRVTRLPWDSGPLGDYLVCGWLRPDHFPNNVRLRRCDDWWDVFRKFSSDPRFGRRRVRGGLFYSVEHLKRYQMRALLDCAVAEEFKR